MLQQPPQKRNKQEKKETLMQTPALCKQPPQAVPEQRSFKFSRRISLSLWVNEPLSSFSAKYYYKKKKNTSIRV